MQITVFLTSQSTNAIMGVTHLAIYYGDVHWEPLLQLNGTHY